MISLFLHALLENKIDARLCHILPTVKLPKSIGRVSVDITNSGEHFVWEDYGLNLTVPENSLPPDVEKCVISISACLSAPFQAPKGHDLVSAVYGINCDPEFEFVQDITPGD